MFYAVPHQMAAMDRDKPIDKGLRKRRARVNPVFAGIACWILLLGAVMGLPAAGVMAQSGPVSPVDAEKWRPARDSRFDVQISEPLMLERVGDVLALDLDETSAGDVALVRASGTHAACLFSAGTLPANSTARTGLSSLVVGRPVTIRNDRFWLDVRDVNLVAPYVEQKLRECRDKGFEAAIPLDLEAYMYRSGFAIGRRQQVEFSRYVAQAAHSYGLLAGLWNTRSQLAELAEDYDFSVMIGCFDEGWCADTAPFKALKKPIFLIQYDDSSRPDVDFCKATEQFGAVGVIKRRVMDAWLKNCPPPDLKRHP